MAPTFGFSSWPNDVSFLVLLNGVLNRSALLEMLSDQPAWRRVGSDTAECMIAPMPGHDTVKLNFSLNAADEVAPPPLTHGRRYEAANEKAG